MEKPSNRENIINSLCDLSGWRPEDFEEEQEQAQAEIDKFRREIMRGKGLYE